MKPSILFDIDGVLFNWSQGFGWYMEDIHGIKPAIHPNETTVWDMADVFPGVNIIPYISQYAASDQYVDMPYFDGAHEFVHKMRDKFPKHEFHAITCCGWAAQTKYRRAGKLMSFGFDGIHMLGITQSKVPTLAMFDKGTVMFDDSPKQILAIAAAGHKPIIIDTTYNRVPELDGHVRAVGFKEAVRLAKAFVEPLSVPAEDAA